MTEESAERKEMRLADSLIWVTLAKSNTQPAQKILAFKRELPDLLGEKNPPKIAAKSSAERTREWRARKKKMLELLGEKKPDKRRVSAPKSATERKRESRARKKKLLESLGVTKRPKSVPKTAAERKREWRARKKMLQSENRPQNLPFAFACQLENCSNNYKIKDEIQDIYRGIESSSEMMSTETEEDSETGLRVDCILTEKEEDLIITDEGIITKAKEEENLAKDGEVKQTFLWLEDRRDSQSLMEPSGTLECKVLKDNIVDEQIICLEKNFVAIEPWAKTTAERMREYRARKNMERCFLWLEDEKDLQLLGKSSDTSQPSAKTKESYGGSGAFGDAESKSSSLKAQLVTPELDKFEALSLLWLSKLCELEDTQKILAKALIDQVLTIASFDELTKNTCVVQKFS